MVQVRNRNWTHHLNRITVNEEFVHPKEKQEEIPIIDNHIVLENNEQLCDTTICLDKAINFKLQDWYVFFIVII